MIPKGVLDEVDKVCKQFLWGGNQTKHRPAMINWEQVCQPKRNEGLGLKNTHLWNMAAMGMHIWNLASKKDMLWVKWVAAIYLKGDDFWSHTPTEHSSWYWRKLVEVREVLKQGYRGGRWIGDASGTYTISSGYKWLLGSRSNFDMWKVIWKSYALPRHSFLLWLVAHDRLYTLDRLHR